jgi:hypothetical protein
MTSAHYRKIRYSNFFLQYNFPLQDKKAASKIYFLLAALPLLFTD